MSHLGISGVVGGAQRVGFMHRFKGSSTAAADSHKHDSANDGVMQTNLEFIALQPSHVRVARLTKTRPAVSQPLHGHKQLDFNDKKDKPVFHPALCSDHDEN